MGSDLLHAGEHADPGAGPILCATKGLVKASGRERIWAYVRDQRPWAGDAATLSRLSFAPIGRRKHVLDHLANASGILQAERLQGVCQALKRAGPDGLPYRFTRGLPVATCAVTSTTPGIDQIRDRPQALDRVANSMTLTRYQWPSLLTSVTRHVKSQPAERLRRSLLGPSNSSWAIPGKEQFAKDFRYGLNRRKPSSLFLETVACHRQYPALNAPCDDWNRKKNCCLPGRTPVAETTRPRHDESLKPAKAKRPSNPQALSADILDRIHDHKINRF